MSINKSLVAPDDREHFFADFQRLFFTDASCVSTLVKVRFVFCVRKCLP